MYACACAESGKSRRDPPYYSFPAFRLRFLLYLRLIKQAKIIMRSPGTHNPKRNNICARPTQSRPREENFSLAILAEAYSPYIRVTNQVEDMLKSRRK
jgi:hypothetical protein